MKKCLLALAAVASLALLAGDAQAFGGRVVVRSGGFGRSNVVVAGGSNVVVRSGFRPSTVIVNGGGQSGFSTFNSFQSFGGCGVGSRAIIVP